MAGMCFSTVAGVTFSAACLTLTAAWCLEHPQTKKDSPPPPHLVAIATERIERRQQEVQVFRGNERVKLPRFTELLVARAADGADELDRLPDQHVAVVKSLKQAGRWEVHANVTSMGELTLPENIFAVKMVIVSSGRAPVEVHVNGKTLRLEPGQVILILG